MHLLCTLQSAKSWKGLWDSQLGEGRRPRTQNQAAEPQGTWGSSHGSNAGEAFNAGDACAKHYQAESRRGQGFRKGREWQG